MQPRALERATGSNFNFGKRKRGRESITKLEKIAKSERITKIIEELTELAIKGGADKDLIKYIRTEKIEVAGSWVRWKCRFGCLYYGNSLCCPPFIPAPEETKKLVAQYKHAMVVGFRGKTEDILKKRRRKHGNMNKTMVNLERAAFFKGFVKAIAFITGTCLLCEKCIIQEEDMKEIPAEIAWRYCRHKDEARLSPEAAGIDVFTTVHNAGLELEVLHEKNIEKMRRFGLILLE